MATEVEAKVEGLKILHFYGHLGSLKGCEKEGRKYCKYDLENIPKAAETIHLIQRDIKTNEATEMAARMCRDAEVIAFLGFGFHPENIRALRPDLWKHESEPLEVYATSKGLPQLVQRAAQNIIRQKIEWHNSAFDVCAFVRNVPILVDV